MSNNKKDRDSFENEEIPSVSKLLNIKKLTKTKEVEAPIPEADLDAPTQEITRPSAKQLGPKIKRILASVKKTKPLVEWSLLQLKQGSDPLGHGLLVLLEKGANAALFLTIAPPGQGSTVPTFKAKAAYAHGEKLQLWQGLVWDPVLMPDVWNVLIKTGMVELAPPGAHTDIKSKRNVIRGAFGVRGDEWITLARVGPPERCRGILAIISRDTVLTAVSFALQWLIQEPKKEI